MSLEPEMECIPNTVSSSTSSEEDKAISQSIQGIDLNLAPINFHPSGAHDSEPLAVSGAIKKPELAPRIVCYLDRVTPSGYLEGWARDERSRNPCVLLILQNGIVIAEAVADSFRLDLLEAGIGHGHFAFYARVHDVESGEYELEVKDKPSGAMIPVSGVTRHFIPALGKSRPAPVQDLLRRRCWTANDLVQHVGCLHLSENLQAMGPYRFVDVTYMYLLNRWMDETGLRYVQQLEFGEISPELFFEEIAFSDELVDRSRILAGPFDGRFPYSVF